VTVAADIQSQKRKPRFSRVSGVSIAITDRDIAIVRAVYKHRFLRSCDIATLVGGSAQNILRRLEKLYHTQYLDRPRAQLDFLPRAGSVPIVYALGNKGAALLAERDGIPKAKVDWTWKNRDVGRVFLEHTLLVARVMVACEVACRDNGAVRLIDSEEILASVPEATRRLRNPFQWHVSIRDGYEDLSVSVVPDKVFGLHFLDEPEGQSRAYFFLEADRATMPVMRGNLRQSSIYKKLVGYHATWKEGIHTEHFGFKRFRVLFVTSTTERAYSMFEANRTATEGRGSRVFLFTDVGALSSKSILEQPLRNGQGEHIRLID
jgi:DNA-binding Lrp family transcriptional regulator